MAVSRYILPLSILLGCLFSTGVWAAPPCPPTLLIGSTALGGDSCNNPGSASASPVSGYFVDASAGNDNNSGTSPASPWRTLGKVSSQLGSAPAGTDVWLKSGTVFENQTITIHWSGTDSNPAVFGCYYVSNGQAYRCEDTHNKPEINGTFDAACRAQKRNGTLCYAFGGDGSSVSNAIPRTIYDALVQVRPGNTHADGEKNIVIENLKLMDSAGAAVNTGNRSSGVVVQGLEIAYTGHAAINAGYDAYHTVIQNNEIHHTIYCPDWFRPGSPGQDRIPDACVLDYPPTIGIARNYNENSAGTWTIVQNNDIYHSHGEAIGCNFASRALIRGNRIRDTRKNGIYIADCPRSRVESNIIWNSPEVDADFGDYDTPVGIAIHIETDLPGHRDNHENLIRNNIVAATGNCFEQSAWYLNGKIDRVIGAKWLNNTCLEPTSHGARMHPTSAVNSAQFNVELIFENNIVYAPNALTCNAVNSVAVKSFRNNMWDSNPSDTDCRDNPATDKIGKPNLARDADRWDKQNWTTSRGPTFADAVLVSGAGVNDGKSQQSNFLNFNEYALWQEVTYPFRPSGTVWNKLAAYDAAGNLRSTTTPNIGADESN